MYCMVDNLGLVEKVFNILQFNRVVSVTRVHCTEKWDVTIVCHCTSVMQGIPYSGKFWHGAIFRG